MIVSKALAAIVAMLGLNVIKHMTVYYRVSAFGKHARSLHLRQGIQNLASDWDDAKRDNEATQPFEKELKNRKGTTETVALIERNWFGTKICDSNMPFNKIDANSVEFVVQPKLNEIRTVVYTVETKW